VAAEIDPNLRIRSVELAVSDLPRSIDFYERVLGLPLIAREPRSAALGPDGERPALLLSEIAEPQKAPPGSTGLFHVAWLHPTRAALAASVRRVAGEGWRFDGASDHGVSEALYLHDPDGLGIELYADRPRERWQREAGRFGDAREASVSRSGGRGVAMVTLPLDVEDLLAQAAGAPPPSVPPGTGVGHVHLKVADVERAAAFYEGLGFAEQARLPSAAFVAAGGYHHHVGLNSWQSAGGAPSPAGAPDLRGVTFELSDAAALDELERAAGPAGRREDGVVTLRDPDGESLIFSLGR
jgi:catechol 2,3-dioxygenase